MDNIRLPVEICEHIIDLMDDAYPLGPSYIHWCRTCLVCSAWVPRSRLNLYRTVYLTWSNAGSLLLRTLQENSHLGSLVVKLSIGYEAGYIPLPRLARLLKNCVILDLVRVQWEHYPPHCTDTCLYPFSLLGIVNLSLTVKRSTARTLLRFIHSLAMLEELSIRGYDEIFRVGPIGARRSQNRKPAALSNLKKLDLIGHTTCLKFPLTYFGDAVVDLYLDIGYQISTELLKCIQNFHQLQTLYIFLYLLGQDDTYDPPPMSRIRTLFSILRSVPSGLHALSLGLHPDYNPNSYHVDRSGLLDLLVGADMLEVLNGFPSLSQLSFELYENDEAYDAVWWKEEMVTRLPNRIHAVTIKLYMDETYYGLWLTEDEITILDTQRLEYLSRATDEDVGGMTLDVERGSDDHLELHADNLGETMVSHTPFQATPSNAAAALEPDH